ncbi:MAG TPA: aldehyde dehydrogenase family protein [Dehalococcoidales bacterium]|nr:aldehyde dehydrogenase family protein [Dehalococcoidales bacterium]
MQEFKMWIGGQYVAAESGKTFKVYNPANEEVIAEPPEGGIAEVNKAVAAAQKAWPVWRKKTQAERSRVLLQIAEALKANVAELARLDTLDHGTSARGALMMAGGMAGDFEYAARAAQNFMDEKIPAKGQNFNYFQREPVGVCAVIVPWNAALGVVITKVSAALAVGNTCVVKPPSCDCLTTLKFGEILAGVDLPPGALNIITGPGGLIGDALASHPGVDMVTFTGSSETGKAVMAAASKTVKRLALELGGKNPFIVFDDADLDTAVFKAVMTTCANTGQICASPGRFYVQEKVYDEFVAKFTAAASKVVVGDPNDPKAQMGPVVSAEHRAKIESYYKIGVEEGARLVLGGKRPTEPPLNKGYYVVPTVFADVTQNMRIAREEIFGPTAVILKFSTEEQVIEYANDTVFGLCASVWCKDLPRAIRLASEIRAGTIWINDHMIKGAELIWGGFKESGFGKENGIAGLEEYTQLKWIAFDLKEAKK